MPFQSYKDAKISWGRGACLQTPLECGPSTKHCPLISPTPIYNWKSCMKPCQLLSFTYLGLHEQALIFPCRFRIGMHTCRRMLSPIMTPTTALPTCLNIQSWRWALARLVITYSVLTVMVYIQLCHRLQPGEAMTFNNRRVLHSRTAIQLNGGVRHLQVYT